MKKILILGGGFGGIKCALDLEKKLTHSTGSGQEAKVQITLVDKNSYHLFLPSLYEVASACEVNMSSGQLGGDPFMVKLRKTICVPYGEIFDGRKVNFIQAEIFKVDLSSNNITTKGGEVLPYDYLVIALGSQTADFGITGVKEYAYQFKSIDDALAINLKIGKLVKKMASGEKMDQLKILIGGAGFSGIEFAAEISGCVNKAFENHNIKTKNASITLVEAGPKILSMVSEKERKVISKRLTKLGVRLMESSPIEEVGDGFVKIKNGQTLEGDMVVWTAGIKANEFLRSIAGLPITDKGKIVIDENLQVQGWKNVFAAGDNQDFIDPKTKKSVPDLAYAAIDQGKIVARNICHSLAGRNLKRYKPSFGVWIAPVGGKFALVHSWKGLAIGGIIGWIIRELVDLRYLISILSFKRGILVFRQDISVFKEND